MQQTSSQLFDDLQHQYFRAWFRYHPEEAVAAGVEGYAELLRAYDDDDIGALIKLNQKLVSALEEIDEIEMDSRRKADYKILKGAVSIELHELQEHDWRARNPLLFIPLNAIYQLLICPVNDVQKSLKRRIQQIPDYLRGAKVHLSSSPESVVPIWLELAIEKARAGMQFIRELDKHPFIQTKFSNPARLQVLFDQAALALEDFANFLEKDITPKAAGDFACGPAHFDRLLNEKHFFETNAEEVLKIGESLFEKTQQQLQEHVDKMKNDSVSGVLKKIQQEHPRPEKLLSTYRIRIRDIVKWLKKKNLVNIPEGQTLLVQETPGFMKNMIPFAAYQPPAPNDENQRGIYYVTQPENERLLSEHNKYSIDLTCVHESYPGHHLQFVTANLLKKVSVTRKIHHSASMYEGWALYCERLMVEKGFFNQDEHIFIMLRDRLWRALRIIIDVKIHTMQLSFDDACELMCEKLGFKKEQARGELSWYSAAPATPLCYAIGESMISAIKSTAEKDKDYSAIDFHQDLLSQGSIALPVVIHEVFGEYNWRHVHSQIFKNETL